MDHVAPRADAVADFSGWLPIRVFLKDNTAWVDWIYRGDYRFEDSFFRDDVNFLLRKPFNRAFRRYTSMAVMVEWAERELRRGATQHAPLKAFVAHASRCGSTLVAQMLAHLPTHVVMSEPPMLDVLLSIGTMLPQITRDVQIRWLRALVFALAQTPQHEHHLVIKLDAWHVFSHDLLAEAFPGVPCLFLFRNPVEIAASMLAQPSAYMAAGMVTAYSRLGADEPLNMQMEDFIARDLGLLFASAAILCDQYGVIPVPYTTLPQAVWTDLGEVLGLTRSADETALLQHVTKRDAKAPSMTFAPDSERKQRETSALLRELVSDSCNANYVRLLASSARVATDAFCNQPLSSSLVD